MMKRKMRLLFVFLALPGMLLAHPALAQQAPADKAAKAQETKTTGGAVIQIPEATFDFGEVVEGESVTHQFVVKNTGTDELQIAQVRPG